MRKILLFLLAASQLMPFLSSCSKDEDKDSSLSVEYDYSQSIPRTGGTATFSIKANTNWSVSNTDEWVTSIDPKQGSGNQTVTVTFGSNNTTSSRSSIFVIAADNLKQEVLITQVAGKLPSAAGTISGDSEGFGSVTLSIVEIENANTYKWYKDGVEVQNSQERTYIATSSGTYTVAGVNAVGEGLSSPVKVVSVTSTIVFEDLPEGSFTAVGEPIANVTGNESWSGTVSKKTEGAVNYYIISHWGGSESEYNFNVPLQCKDGLLIVDSETLVVSDTTTTPGEVYKGYFYAFYIDANSTMYIIDGFSPEYDKDETTISFSGTYNGYSVYVGVIALLNGEYAGIFSEIYENARVVIAPSTKGNSSVQLASGVSSEKAHTGKLLESKKLKYGGRIQFNPTKLLSE